MKQLICISMYNDLPIKTYNLSEIDNSRLIEMLESAPEGTLFVYTNGKPSDKSVIMCPGGGFLKTNFIHEGIDFSAWFLEREITYAVFKYRMPYGNPDIPKQDIQVALRVMREKLPEYCRQIGVMGASIGGYLATYSATCLAEMEKPDFQILMYPVVSISDNLTHLPCRERMFGKFYSPDKVKSYSPIEHITSTTSPAFVVLAADDTAVSPQNGILYAARLQKAGVSVSLHVYPTGGHGFGYNDSFVYKQEWLMELERWLR